MLPYRKAGKEVGTMGYLIIAVAYLVLGVAALARAT